MSRSFGNRALLALIAGSVLTTFSAIAEAQLQLAKSDSGNATIDVAAQLETQSASKGSVGSLNGRLSNASGTAVADQDVTLRTTGSKPFMFRATTDANGDFSLPIQRGGVYILQAADQVAICRVWAANQAPPAAIDAVQLVTHTPAATLTTASVDRGLVVRGQGFSQSYGGGGGVDGGCGSYGQSTLGGFQNCDSACGEPPILSNCETYGGGCGKCGAAGGCGGKCGCGGCCNDGCGGGGWFSTAGGRSKLLVALLGGAIIGVALDQDDAVAVEEPAS